MADAAILSVLLPMLCEKLASGTLQQLEEMLGVPRELEKLRRTLTAIQSVLQDAEAKEVKDAALRDWLSKLKDAAYDADDLLDEAHYELLWRNADIHHGIINKVNDFFSSHNPLFFRAKMAGKVKDIVNKLDEVAAERSKFHLRIGVATAEQWSEWRQTHSYVIESEVIGRQEDKKRIVEMLLGDEGSKSGGSFRRVLPIVGMGGLGKTTLAQMVLKEQKVTERFEPRMWVYVSEEFSISRIAKEIIASAGGSVAGDASMDQLQHKLRETLGFKRYLLVLDDVWDENPHRWEQLRVLLTFGAEGSAIIVTTRSEAVATIVGTLDPYLLAHMPLDDCWVVFEQKAFPGGKERHPHLVEIGKEIVKRCRGLPLAAKVIGSMMRLKRKEKEWLDVLNSEVWDMQDEKDGILHVLKLSYHQLPPHLKQCFVLCAIFPKDHKIRKEQLIQLWMANDFIPSGGRLQLEEKGENIFKELASRSFFQDIYVGQTITTCKVHDLLHDLARSIMSNECVILNDERITRISAIRYLVITDGTSSSTLCNNLYNFRRTLRALVKLPYYSSALETVTSSINFSELVVPRVLDLHHSLITMLPISVNNLKHLRYLDLSWTKLEMLPEAISQLFHLQTLRIEGCRELRKLPKGIGNMCNLRHVYNRGCGGITSMPRGLDKLSNLQTLTTFVASREVGSGGIAELKDLNLGGVLYLRNLENVLHGEDAKEAHLSSKKKIKSLVLEWGRGHSHVNSEEILEALQPHEDIGNLRIFLYNGQQPPSWMVRCHMLKKLEIENCLRLREIPCLPSLTELSVTHCPLLSPTYKGFFRSMTSLENLHIRGSDQLVLLTEREEDGDYGWSASLRCLSICDCEARMFSSESCLGMWKNLISLQILKLDQCSGLISLPDELMCGLYSLKALRIGNCKRFTGGEGGLRLQHLTSLEHLHIDECKALPSVSLENLQRIQVLDISQCYKLKLNGLGGLTALCELTIIGSAAEKVLPDCLQGLTALKIFEIQSCPALTTLPDGMEGLTLLQDIRIYDCPMLAALPVGLQQHLPHLQHLKIIGCPELERSFRTGGDYCHLISSIPSVLIR